MVGIQRGPYPPGVATLLNLILDHGQIWIIDQNFTTVAGAICELYVMARAWHRYVVSHFGGLPIDSILKSLI